MTKKALITGIDGFTGMYLAEALEKAGYEVARDRAAFDPARSPCRGVFLC